MSKSELIAAAVAATGSSDIGKEFLESFVSELSLREAEIFLVSYVIGMEYGAVSCLDAADFIRLKRFKDDHISVFCSGSEEAAE